ncbi:hypothetical protein I3843_02G039700, partial [Carya illinoinensis]
RIGLLQLRSFLISVLPLTTSSDNLVPSLVDHEKSDCCGWERVKCNSTTGHMIELSLNNLKKYHDYAFTKDQWLLNVSLLKPFKELRSLDLSFNAIGGCIQDEGMLLGMRIFIILYSKYIIF